MENTRPSAESSAVMSRVEVVFHPDGTCEIKLAAPLENLDEAFDVIAALGWIR